MHGFPPGCLINNLSRHEITNPRLTATQETPDSELITYCLSAPHDRIIGGIPKGNLVVRVSKQTVIKFGPGLSRDEAINQQNAYDFVDHNIVRVPRVHRFFADNCGRGYIMMDYVQGKVVNPLGPDHVKRLARVLDYFSTIKGKIPGSLGGGPCHGLLWPETQDLTFRSLEKMEAWFNSRLFPGEGKVSFQNCDLVLCHLDIAPRNIIWQS